MRKLKFISIMSELGAGTRGASLGLDALKVASLNANSSFFKQFPFEEVETENELLFDENPTPNGKNISGIARLYTRTANKVAEDLSTGFFPVIVSGDHSCAGGTIAGIKKAFPNKRLGVVWIDAHADLHSPFTTPSGNVHGMPLATAIADDNKEHAINSPNEETEDAWERMKGEVRRLNPEDLVFVSVRDTETPEEGLMAKYSIPNFTTDEVRTKGVEAIAKQCLDHLKACDLLYVSFDVDSMDCEEVSKGTGTPVPHGLMPAEAEALIQSLLADPRTCCFEMVEINPCLDNKGNVMAETAFKILETTVSNLS